MIFFPDSNNITDIGTASKELIKIFSINYMDENRMKNLVKRMKEKLDEGNLN